ncbi:MAG: 2-oxo acid dehydrogenase subunit E2 [Desulfitobacteriaceae bacterium]|nr:2-oxo acid dehydrogenase subunit E2 [Desulfitobacteriaceae bacterium]MDI6913785.1 2-oxo acid dehydrogenase subunit E2 [Desulfitobacteriaceae bacterium]
MESPATGILEQIIAADGALVPVGEAIGVIAESKVALQATPRMKKLAKELGIDLAAVVGTGPNGRITEQDLQEHQQEALNADPVKATATARKMAAAEGVSLPGIQGSGVSGRIQKTDVQHALHEETAEKISHLVLDDYEVLPLTGMRKMIGDNMAASAFSAPHVTLTTEVVMDQAVQLRQELREKYRNEAKITFTDFINAVVIKVLQEMPEVNATLEGNEIRRWHKVNLALAVARKKGLIVPVLKNAGRKSLTEISQHTADLVERARADRLTLEEIQGGTFTVSNLGMYDIDGFTPIINPPQAAILGVGRILERAVVVEHEVMVKPTMVLSISFDHRIMDGDAAARFLKRLKYLLENPYQPVVE